MVAKKYHTVERVCDHCRVLFMASRYNKNEKQYCGNSCSISARRSSDNSTERTCQTCRVSFTTWNSQPRKFCSVDCANVHRSNKSEWFTVLGHKCQGIYESLFVAWAVSCGLRFKAHQMTLTWVDGAGNPHRYHPDFWIDDWSCYVDIKSDWTKALSSEKMSRVLTCNPELDIRVLADAELLELGVKLDRSVQHAFRCFLKVHKAVDDIEKLKELKVI